jgi:hypothetical protein
VGSKLLWMARDNKTAFMLHLRSGAESRPC